MNFSNFKNLLERPYVVYADFECSLIPSDEPGILHKHEPNSAAYYFVDTFKPDNNYLRSFVGKDCVSKLILDLNDISTKCIEQ